MTPDPDRAATFEETERVLQEEWIPWDPDLSSPFYPDDEEDDE